MKTADGFVLIDGRMVRGHAVSEGGVTELFEGPCTGKADLYGVAPFVDFTQVSLNVFVVE